MAAVSAAQAAVDDVAEPARQAVRDSSAEAEVEASDEQLAEAAYNATITAFERLTRELWILRVHADSGPVSFVPGQYASLGLGFWEPRVDDAVEADLAVRRTKLVRRSYSISSPIFAGDPASAATPLAGCTDQDELELYVVLVEPEGDFVPGLTPRLALKDVGDRLFLGRKMAGRYTTAAVTDPDTTMVFLSTGTGEAPQNAMIAELLRTGHRGPIVSVITSRKQADFAYLAKHRALEARFSNYRYLALPTREPGVPKRYLQDVVREDFTPDGLGVELDPATTHVFICGNPAMIGLPEEVDGETAFPETTGVVELLVERGFALDLRKRPGTIHVEEYW
jgi:ferredoxin--NADP+ reductase